MTWHSYRSGRAGTRWHAGAYWNAFLGFVFLTHNLLVWTKAALFAGTRLVAIHTRELVEKIVKMPAFLVRHGRTLRLELLAVYE